VWNLRKVIRKSQSGLLVSELEIIPQDLPNMSINGNHSSHDIWFLNLKQMNRSWGNSVSIVTSLWARCVGFDSWQGQKGFSFSLPPHPDCLQRPPNFLLNEFWVFFSEGKVAGACSWLLTST
jgi:hypothetical protein